MGSGETTQISEFPSDADGCIDLVLTSHRHVAEQARTEAEATIPASKYEKGSRPSTWLLTVNYRGLLGGYRRFLEAGTSRPFG